ncbi:hypothetical protein EGH22_19255 [Halomicroarcula sp. F28]|nr:hypothetical protein [Halomicroarcula salinisoli]MBX0288473.1 hypothetical protein [Halomicroarcula salinisoli]
MSKAAAVHVEYRCLACAYAFVESLTGVTACPRCGSIDNHEQLGHGLE